MTAPSPRTHQITRYLDWLASTQGLRFDDYEALWRWSVSDLSAFWQSIWDYFGVESPTPHTAVLGSEAMPGAQWFPGAQVNYAQHLFSHADAAHAAGHAAIWFQDEAMQRANEMGRIGWPELRRQVASIAAHLRRLGVQRGDRVAAFLPNTPTAIIAFLACASIGAVWSVCSPDMGPVAVLDRWRQIEPKVLIACDRYRYGHVVHDRRGVLDQLVAQLPSVRHVLLQSDSDGASLADASRQVHSLAPLLADDVPFEAEWLPFDHPIWIVYSSGTTGLPKPIVHGHGGVMLEGLKLTTLQNDVGPSVRTGDRFHWYSSTGWIMWNCQVGGLLGGSTICLFDGSPAGPQGATDWSTLWRFAADSGVTFFGAGAAFYASCLKADVHPMTSVDLSALRAVGSTGSPLAAECYAWVRERLPKVDGREIWLTAISGGTDFAGAFIGGVPTLPVIDGEMQCRCLGAAVEAWSEPDAEGRGHPLIGEVGELVCVRPMPSMPLYFWGDPGNQRYLDSYFDMYPGIWRHGDWLKITQQGGAIIYGRSDATINRHGIRMGTAELYRAVEALPEVIDSLVVDLEYLGRESYMPLFVVLRDGVVLDDALVRRMKDVIRQALSARHVPNEIFHVEAVPRTLSGKKMELPVKKLLMGASADQVLNRDAMANAASVDWFAGFAERRRQAGH